MAGSSTMTAVTFRISSDLKDRVDKLANTTGLSSSYFYNQLVSDHIDELEDIYDCLAIIENVKKGKEKTVPLEKVMSDSVMFNKDYVLDEIRKSEQFADDQKCILDYCMRVRLENKERKERNDKQIPDVSGRQC